MSVVPGLEDVAIKYTSLTYIDGVRGILRYRGYDIGDLARSALYEEVAYLMLYGDLPTLPQLKDFMHKVESGYDLPQYVRDEIRALPRDADPVSVMEVAFASMSAEERDFKWDKSRNRDVAAVLIGRVSAVTAEIYRHIMGLERIKMAPGKTYARAFLEGAFGSPVPQEKVEAMNRALILYVDHEVPASTTAALVASSTLSDMYSGTTAALAALKGPLHGGAAEAAFRQFLEIGSVEEVDRWFQENIVKGKRRLMGFGHRVYKTYDPRMRIFKETAKSLVKGSEERRLFEVAERLEELGVNTFGSKGIYPNTDYYSGVVFDYIGFPVEMFTALFALSRVTGWVSHMIEYVENQHRLIRPRAIYVGPDRREFKGIENRQAEENVKA